MSSLLVVGLSSELFYQLSSIISMYHVFHVCILVYACVPSRVSSTKSKDLNTMYRQWWQIPHSIVFHKKFFRHPMIADCIYCILFIELKRNFFFFCENDSHPYIELRRQFQASPVVMNCWTWKFYQISHVVIRQFASTNAVIASLSALTGLPERGVSSTLKLPDRNLAH